jgi:ubiquinol-cytochrome c reductase cytochrome c subunit
VRRRAAAVLLAPALALCALGTLAFAPAGSRAQSPPVGAAGGGAGDPVAGHQLFVERCSSCHGTDGAGRRGRGPSVRGAGALAADFYLRTGRMPLDEPTDQPVRAPVQLSGTQIDDLVAYVASFGGPGVPVVHPERGSLTRGQRLFTDSCAGCHTVAARGGIVLGGVAPALQQANARQVAEAIRMGPYLMPRFGSGQLSPADVDALARYVLSTRDLPNRGGWAIGNLGPVPEGLVCWGLGIVVLLGAARLLGERTT